VALVQLGYGAATAITPLLLVSLVEYLGLQPRHWQSTRWLLVLVPVVLAIGGMVLDDSGTFQRVAAAANAAERSDMINEVRRGPLLLTHAVTYLLALLLLSTVLIALFQARTRRREMIVLGLIALTVVAIDALHFTMGFTVAGHMPTPYALLGALLLSSLPLYRSNMFDLRPIARNVLIDSVRDGMMVVDGHRRIIDCNRAGCELLGRSRSEIFGRPAEACLPREFAAMLQSTVHLRAELGVDAPDGRLWFEVDVTPLALHHRTAGHLIIARDISERRMVQDALQESRRALEGANARLVEQSVTDPLTGLKNRRFLFQRLNEEMNRHHRAGELLGLLVVDLDHFKAVNDTHGHPVGDEALVQVASALHSSVRDCDVVARLGGEEFAILAMNTEAEGLLGLAERIRKAIARTPVAGDSDRPIRITASIGVAFAGPDSRTVEGLFAEADRYLYAAKHRGRNRVEGPPPVPDRARSTG
jgi:diguanylate cyclase (GGDEF)-like protein/PAS domain S-box-containing protein